MKAKKCLLIVLFLLLAVLVYAQEYVKDVTVLKNENSRSFDNKGLNQGILKIVELGYQMGVGDLGMDRLKLNVIIGYQANPYFSFGLGMGLRFYAFSTEEVVFPLFANIKVNFADTKISPYISLGAGYSVNKGYGFLFNPNVGLSFKISDKNTINVGIGYEIQKRTSSGPDDVMIIYYPGGYISTPRPKPPTNDLDAISIVVGISF